MIEYAYDIEQLGGEIYCVTFPDFPMLKICAEGHYDARAEAQAALNALVSIRIRERLEIPLPTPAFHRMALCDTVVLRLKLYWRLVDEGITLSVLSRRIGLRAHMIRDMLDGIESDDNFPHVQQVARASLAQDDSNVIGMCFPRFNFNIGPRLRASPP